jgi:excisionase family DNA binding protein
MTAPMTAPLPPIARRMDGQSPYLTPAEVAATWGLLADTVRAHVRTGRLPARKVGRLVRISRDDAEAYVGAAAGTAGRQTPSLPPLEQARALLASLSADERIALAREALSVPPAAAAAPDHSPPLAARQAAPHARGRRREGSTHGT